MNVVKRMAATSAPDLEEISWRIHDASFDPASVSFDAGEQTVTLRVRQEPRDVEQGLPVSARVRETWRFVEYAVPFLDCLLTVHRATGVDVPDDLQEVPSDLVSLEFDERDGVVTIWTGAGKIEVPVDGLEVEFVITDVIAEVMRRRVGRGRRWDSTTPWPAERRREVEALVRDQASPAPALHDVSAIVRPPRDP